MFTSMYHLISGFRAIYIYVYMYICMYMYKHLHINKLEAIYWILLTR